MTLDLDGMAILGVIGANPHLFLDVASDAANVSRKLVVKQLKSTAPNLLRLREVRKALGRNSFVLIVEGMSDSEVKSLASKYDKFRQEIKNSDAAWRRSHLCELAEGKVDLASKPAPKIKPKTPAKPKTKTSKPKVLDLQSMKQTRGRRK